MLFRAPERAAVLEVDESHYSLPQNANDEFFPDTRSPEEFIVEYQNPEYDVSWVASHGLLDLGHHTM